MKIEKRSPYFQVPDSGLENISWNLAPISPAITIPNNMEYLFCSLIFKKRIYYSGGICKS
jgi:hypothetical protein